MERDFEYEKNNVACDGNSNWSCPHAPKERDIQCPMGGIKCKNYELCESVLPEWWFDCKCTYICTNCDMMFGKALKVIDNLECVICLEIKRSMSYPNCDHTSCIECFKRCYYGDCNVENEPVFPYPEIKDEYDDDENNPIWELEYPLIKKYNEEWNAWDDERLCKYEDEKNLRMCPLCRK